MPKSNNQVRAFRNNLRSLEREVYLVTASETACCGVSLAQCHLLMELDKLKQSTISELATDLELDKSTLSRTVESLKRTGLVEREVNSENRRQQFVRLSDMGQQKADSINKGCDSYYQGLLKLIPAEKRKSVLESIELLSGAMRELRRKEVEHGQ